MTDRLLNEFEQPRHEVIPLTGVEEQIEHLPPGATVTVTCPPPRDKDKSSPAKNEEIAATLDLSERLVGLDRGLKVVPHLAARMIESPAELDQILDRLGQAGIRSVFVVGGDAKPAKGQTYGGSLELAAAIHKRDSEIELGSTAYPEGHPDILDEVLRDDLLQKQQYVGYVATQMCFEADKIIDWADDMRGRGMEVPVKVGVPGVVNARKLIKISRKIGVGASMRYLEKFSLRDMARLLLTGKQKQTNLVHDLEPALNDPDSNLDGFHIFSFNEIEATERWRRRALEAHIRGEQYDINRTSVGEVGYHLKTVIDGLLSR